MSATQSKVGNGSITSNILDHDKLLKYLQGHIHTRVCICARAHTHTYQYLTLFIIQGPQV